MIFPNVQYTSDLITFFLTYKSELILKRSYVFFYTFNMYLNDFKDMKNLIYFFLFKFDFSAGVILQHIHILVIKLKKIVKVR